MKPARLLSTAGSFIGLVALGFLFANFFVGSGSTKTVEDVARTRCIQDGFPADRMSLKSLETDTGMFGFGGTATVELVSDGRFGPDGKPKMEPLAIRVKLSRHMNLSSWEVVNIEHQP